MATPARNRLIAVSMTEVANMKKWVDGSGLTITEIAERAGFSQSYLSLVLNGNRPPTDKLINKLAEALGVTRDALLADPLKQGSQAYLKARLTATKKNLLSLAQKHGLAGENLDFMLMVYGLLLVEEIDETAAVDMMRAYKMGDKKSSE